MPILRVANFEDFYRHLVATEFASRRILEALELAPDDTLLDVGCGDGWLLRLAESLVRHRMGIVPTVEERLKLEREFPGISFQVGVAQRLPLASESFSKIVCNSVLLLLGSEEAAVAGLKEIARVARPQAAFGGKIPAADELSRFSKYKRELGSRVSLASAATKRAEDFPEFGKGSFHGVGRQTHSDAQFCEDIPRRAGESHHHGAGMWTPASLPFQAPAT